MKKVTDYWRYTNYLEKIKEAQKLIKDFFRLDDIPYPTQAEKAELETVRREINLNLKEILQAVRSGGESSEIFYSPPPITGGIQGWIDIFTNIFLCHQYEIGQSHFIDKLERAEGFYRYWIKYWQYKRWNPYYWLKMLFVEWIMIPVQLAEAIRLKSGDKKKDKLWVRIGSLIIGFISYILINGAAILGTFKAIKFFTEQNQ